MSFLKTKNIKVYKNNKILSKSDFSLSDNGLIYLNYTKNKISERLYFLVNDLGNKDSKIIIKDFKISDENNSIQFSYEGSWESETKKKFKIIQVNNSYKIVFNNANEFKKIKNKIDSCQNNKSCKSKRTSKKSSRKTSKRMVKRTSSKAHRKTSKRTSRKTSKRTSKSTSRKPSKRSPKSTSKSN